MTETPTCSICIANYNGEYMLAECIDSVLAQRNGPEIEIIVHDDASTDASLHILAKYPDVKVIASRENVGFCVANNRMVEVARGEFILLLNNDAALFPDALHTLLEHARAHTECGILSLPQYTWNHGELIDRGCLLDPFYNPAPNVRAERLDVAMVAGACLWIRRSLWCDIGGFPVWMVSIAEDMYLCCEARRRGLSVQVPNASGYKHHQGQSLGGNKPVQGRLHSTYRRRALSEFNKTAVLVLCTPWPWLVVMLPMHSLTLIVEGLVLAALRQDVKLFQRVYANTLRRLWRERGKLRTLRRTQRAHWRPGTHSYFSAFTLVPRKLVLLWRYGVPDLR